MTPVEERPADSDSLPVVPAEGRHVVVSQDAERWGICATARAAPRWILRYGYGRAGELAAGGQPGQDAVEFHLAPERAVAVVCDGVSESFFGNLAARALAKGVAEILWERGTAPVAVAELYKHVDEIAASARAEVEVHPIPAGLSSLGRKTLARTRANYGSQAVFAAFVADLRARTAQTYQLGNVRLAWSGEDRASCSREAGRFGWSTHLGFLGPVTVGGIDGFSRLVLYTDGFGASSLEEVPELTEAWFQGIQREVRSLPADDDVSFVDLQLAGESPGGQPAARDAVPTGQGREEQGAGRCSGPSPAT